MDQDEWCRESRYLGQGESGSREEKEGEVPDLVEWGRETKGESRNDRQRGGEEVEDKGSKSCQGSCPKGEAS